MNSTTPNIQPNSHQNVALIDKRDFIIMTSISVFSSAFNGLLIYLISRKKRLRPVDYLTGNLCFCTFIMCFTIVSMLSMTQLFQFRSMNSQWMCSLFNYAKYFPGALITLSSFGICFERIRSLTSQNGRIVSGKTALKTILMIWMIALCFTIPAAFATTSNYYQNMATSPFSLCKRIPLFNSKYFDVLYELIKFFFFHILFSCYLLYELYLIRSKFKYLRVYSVPGPRLQKKVCRVRFAFAYSLILVAVWVSSGTVGLISRVPIWFNPSNSNTPISPKSKTFTFIMATSSIYLLIHPMAVFFSIQDIKIFRNLFCRCCSANNPPIPIKDADGMTHATNHENAAGALNGTDLDISRFATHHPTTSSISQEEQEGEKDNDDEDGQSLIERPEDNDNDNGETSQCQIKNIDQKVSISLSSSISTTQVSVHSSGTGCCRRSNTK